MRISRANSPGARRNAPKAEASKSKVIVVVMAVRSHRVRSHTKSQGPKSQGQVLTFAFSELPFKPGKPGIGVTGRVTGTGIAGIAGIQASQASGSGLDLCPF
ncbi:hypothetical protein THIOKS12990011 [Thiocapsa sp. KS1]|nr:hypothetical protein THIOKS12990011 [Thiocapsa sp. KS1]